MSADIETNPKALATSLRLTPDSLLVVTLTDQAPTRIGRPRKVR